MFREKRRGILSKIFFTLFLLLPITSYAQSNKPTTFKNGIDSNTNIIDNSGNILSNLNINQPNGLAGLDSNGNITSNINTTGTLKNGNIQGGIATGTDITSSVLKVQGEYKPLREETTQIASNFFTTQQQKDADVWVSSSYAFPEYTADNTTFIRGTGRTSISISNVTLRNITLQQATDVLSAFNEFPGVYGILKNTTYNPSLPEYRIPCASNSSINVSAGMAILPSHVEIDYNGSVVATDDGNGNINGTGGNGTVNYTTGDISFTFNTTPVSTDDIWVGIWITGGFGSKNIPSTWWKVMDEDGTNDTTPNTISTIGFKPSVLLVNENGCGNENYIICSMTPSDLAKTKIDVQKLIPSIKNVFPYISPNSGIYGSFVDDEYWKYAKESAIQQGGFAIDMPVGYFKSNPETYRQFVVSLIQWAHVNNILVICELSPGNPPMNTEDDYLTDTKWVIDYLKNNSAIPNVWYVDQYVFPVAPGTDDYSKSTYTTNSVLAVARWITDTIPTFDIPTTAKGFQSSGNIVVPVPNVNLTGATRATLGNLFSSLGSLAYQDSSSVNISGGNINTVNHLGLYHNGQLVFSQGDEHSSLFYGDGQGDVIASMGGGALDVLGNIITTGNLSITGGYPVYLTIQNTGPGNAQIDVGNSNGTLTFPENVTSTGNVTTGSHICLDAKCVRYIYEDAVAGKVKIGNNTNGYVFSIDDDGNVITKGSIAQNTTP